MQPGLDSKADLDLSQAKLAQSTAHMNLVVPTKVDDTEIMSCNTLPFPHNPSFHGRRDIIEDIGKHLRFGSDTSDIHSVVIWGAGGIGKTQIALEFANSQLDNEFNAIIWISSETEEEISHSYNKAAATLNLPDYKPENTPTQNKLLVHQWLQTTKQRWLLIFDNVETDTTLTTNWPIVGNGCILVTCRSELIAAGQPAISIEVPVFTVDESSALILRILNRQNVDLDEIKASKELSEKLGGLALALDIIAKQVETRKMSIRSFLPYYEECHNVLHKRPKTGMGDLCYGKDLLTVWKAAFENLTRKAKILMSILCFIAPESVPQWLLTQEVTLDNEYKFLRDPEEFQEVKLELLDLSLIRINEGTECISMHRLIQIAFFDRMEHENRIATLNTVYTLLRKAFPDRSLNGHLYTRWKLCQELAQHALAWRQRYIPIYKGGYTERNSDFTVLIMDLARYIQEIGSLMTCEEIVVPLLDEYPDKKSLVYAYVCIEAGTLYDRTGRSVRAFNVYKTVYEIRIANFAETAPIGNNMANGYSLMNLATVALWQGEAALAWIDKAIDCMSRSGSSDEEIAKMYDADRFWRNRGRTNFILGRLEDSKNDTMQAEKYQVLRHGAHSHYQGESAYMFAKIYYQERTWDKALEQAQRAYDYLAPGKPNHATVIATRFLQAIILIAKGQEFDRDEQAKCDDEALNYLSDALTMCLVNEPQRGNQGESARVKWRMSQILERKGRKGEAQVSLDAALEAKKSLQATGDYPIPDDEEDSWNALVGMLYR